MHQPQTPEDVVAILTDAAARKATVEIVGGGTRRSFGASTPDAEQLATTALSGIISYDPAELVLTARAGTPLAELEAALAECGQAFLFEPNTAPGSTIGGVIGAGLSGSRRVSGGAVRDHLLGFEAVSGRAERFKAGGKVVKNVTGYDLSKLMCGAWGRLAVLTEVTLKVLPNPTQSLTLVWTALDDAAAWDLMGEAMRLPADVAAAAHDPQRGVTLLRIEGFGPSVGARAILLKGALARFGVPQEIAAEEGALLWRPFANAAALGQSPTIWRLSVPRKEGLGIVHALARDGGQWIADWAGGLIHHDTQSDPAMVRATVTAAGGHAMLLRAPDDVRAHVPAQHPLPQGEAALAARIRRAFDPAGLFETGRFLDQPHAD